MAETNQAIGVKEPKQLSFALKTFFGVGDMAFTFMTNLETFYYMYFLTDIAKFSPVLIASITSIASMIDMALSWVYGGILSAVKASKWGRYRSWLILLPWMVPILYAFQYIKISNDDGISAIIITLGAVISHIVWNIAYVANVTLISVVGKTAEGKATMSTNRGAYQSAAGIIFSYIGLPLTTVLGGIVGQSNRFAASAFILAALMAVGYFAHYKMTAGYEDDEVSSTASAAAARNRVSVPDMFRALFQNPQLMILIVSNTASAINAFVFSAAAVYYWRVAAGNIALNNTFILLTSIAALVGAIAAKKVAKKFSARNATIISLIGAAIFFCLMYFFYASPMIVMALAVIGRIFGGSSNALFPVLYADTVVYATWKTGKNAAGWIMGLMTLPIKIGVFARGIVLTAALAGIGYSAKLTPAQFTPQLKQGIAMTFGFIPGICLLVSGLMILFFYRLTQQKVAEYQTEIDKRA